MDLKKREKKRSEKGIPILPLSPWQAAEERGGRKKRMITTTAPGGVPPEGDEPTGHEDESQ